MGRRAAPAARGARPAAVAGAETHGGAGGGARPTLQLQPPSRMRMRRAAHTWSHFEPPRCLPCAPDCHNHKHAFAV